MRILTMKQDATRQIISHEILAAGTASGVWSEEQEPAEKASKYKAVSNKLH